MSIFDLTLEEIGGPTPEATMVTSLIESCRRARRKPIRELVPSDLRVLIGQNLDVEFLLPLAVGLLNADPVHDADYFPGALLLNALYAATGGVAICDWTQNCLQAAVERALGLLDEEDEDEVATAKEVRELAHQLWRG